MMQLKCNNNKKLKRYILRKLNISAIAINYYVSNYYVKVLQNVMNTAKIKNKTIYSPVRASLYCPVKIKE